MKGLAYVLAIIGAICIMKYLPDGLGAILSIVITIGSAFLLIIVFKVLIKLFRTIIKKLDDID